MNTTTLHRIRDLIDDIPVIDIHAHLGTGGMWQARDLTDILFYHWLGTELQNAGCPREVCSPSRNDDGQPRIEPWERVKQAVPYCACIRNTSNYWAFSGILRDLYDIEGGLTEGNALRVYDAVAEKAADPSWELEVLRRARIEKATVAHNCVPRDPTPYVPYVSAEPIYGIGLRSPDTLEKTIGRRVESAEELKDSIVTTIESLAMDPGIRALHVWLPATWRYTEIEACDVDGLLYHWMAGDTLSEYEHNCLASWSADIAAEAAARHGLIVQIFHGSISYGGAQVATWHPEFLRMLILHVARNSDTQFDLFLATRNASHEAAGMARHYPNLTVSGAWWHGFTPSTLTEFFRDRLEMLPMTRWNAFFSDGYCVEWCYGKLLVTRNRLAVALAGLVDEGLIGESDVVPIARAVLYENPSRMYLPNHIG